jgi:hypothetical protein
MNRLPMAAAEAAHLRNPIIAGIRPDVVAGKACTDFRSDTASSAWSFDQRTGVLMQPRVFSRVKEQCLP